MFILNYYVHLFMFSLTCLVIHLFIVYSFIYFMHLYTTLVYRSMFIFYFFLFIFLFVYLFIHLCLFDCSFVIYYSFLVLKAIYMTLLLLHTLCVKL